MPAVRKVSEQRRRQQRRSRMKKPAEPYSTMDQFWRAYQAKERPADLAARENQTLTK
jgi:hypothetical protein